MKKSVKTICLLVVLLGMTVPTQAIDFNWGIKGGINLSAVPIKDLPKTSNTTTTADSSSGPWPK